MPRFEEVLTLGRKLVDELGGEPRVDTLARWMAHYIAELIDAAANAPAREREAAGRVCFEAILALWDHRAALPDGRRPFENSERVMRALESLDPANETPRYFASARRAMESGDDVPAGEMLLDFVSAVDEAARVMIAEALVEAAGALEGAQEWVAVAKAAQVDAGAAGTVLSFLSKEPGFEGRSGRTDDGRTELVDRSDRLERFVKLAAAVSDGLRERLDGLASAQGASGDGAGGESADGARAGGREGSG